MYEDLKNSFKLQFNKEPQWILSVPGRSELGGNHTDHQHGRVLACAIDLDSKAAVALNDEHIIHLQSEGFDLCEVKLPVGKPDETEFGTTTALIKGVVAYFQNKGVEVKGFDAYVKSDVLVGSGLSSSASFEVLVGLIINTINQCGISNEEIAIASQYAENVYFGKPCGLMDQMACSIGNIITIDFKDPSKPVTEAIDFDFSTTGHCLCIIDSGASHADLTDCYAGIPNELKKVCAYFKKDVLRDVDECEFYANLKEVRKVVGDRGILRAMHVYEDNKRVVKMVEALKKNDFNQFLELVTESGNSSWLYLQNVIPEGRIEDQEVALAIAYAKHILNGKGAVRVHGGGFAGTIQAYVPLDMKDEFVKKMEEVLGDGSCHILSIRKDGGVVLEEC